MLVNVTGNGALPLDGLTVKSTVDGSVTVTPMLVVDEPQMFDAFIVTMNVPARSKT